MAEEVQTRVKAVRRLVIDWLVAQIFDTASDPLSSCSLADAVNSLPNVRFEGVITERSSHAQWVEVRFSFTGELHWAGQIATRFEIER